MTTKCSTLLQKTRTVGNFLSKNKSPNLDAIIEFLRDIITANIYVADSSGKVTAFSLLNGSKNDVGNTENMCFPNIYYTISIMNIKETSILNSGDSLPLKDIPTFQGNVVAVTPIYAHGKILGTIIATKGSDEFTDDDMLLVEYVSVFIGMRIFSGITTAAEVANCKVARIKTIISKMSYTEIKVLTPTLSELNGVEGILVTSKIADSYNIARSVVVNALRKLTSARLIETSSLGAKGTYIHILEPAIVTELEKRNSRFKS